MRRAYKYRLYPNREQATALSEILETHRRLYNAALEERETSWEEEQKGVRYGEQSAAFKEARCENEFYARLNFSSAQATLRKLNLAFEAFFRRVKAGETPGYPRFKGRSRFRSVCYPSYGDGCKLRQDSEGRTRLYLQNVGEVKVKFHRPWEGQIKTVTVRREADRWFVVLSCDLEAVDPGRSTLGRDRPNPPVGVDVGLKAFLTTSEGESVDPPRYYREAQKRLRRLQRTVARREKGSARWREACRDVAHLHWRIANKRRDFHHKTALDLVRRYGFIAVEDLNIRGIARSGSRSGTRLAKSTLDVAWGAFLNILESKAESAGVRVVRVPPYNTTQTCSQCGGIPDRKLTLRDRLYSCSHCGHEEDRDANAAKNILAKCFASGLGLSLQAPTPAMAGVA